MNVTKSSALGPGGTPTPAQLEKINLQSKTALTAEQVYCFSVRLCDDQPDRDFERFDLAALPKLAELFIGKTGICDHEWSARGQVARIFDAWTEPEGSATILRAWAYMLRGELADPLIANIEAGIHREVSVGCAMGKTVCSICGEPYGSCEHRKGKVYGGKTCYGVLCDPVDAYEFSFVAVPAQRDAGVMKAFGEEDELRAQLAGAKPLTPGGRIWYKNIPGEFIGGTVYDPVEKEVVIGAKCTLTGEGKTLTAETDSYGDFWFRDLPAGGVYDLRISAPGYAEKRFSAISTEKSVNLDDIPLERA